MRLIDWCGGDEIMMSVDVLHYQFDDLVVTPSAFEVRKAGNILPLEPKSIRVLLYLIENRTRAVGKEELLQAVWTDIAVTDNALTRVIAQLRRELGDDARNPRYIQTIPTLGYRFIADLKPVAVAHVAPRRSSRRMRAGIAAALAIGLPSFFWFVTGKSQPTRFGGAVQITSSAGFDASPSFSPDGRSIAYSSDRSGAMEIYTRRLDRPGTETQLTSDGAQNIHPAWSPDGRNIAFHSVAKGGIWTISVAGGRPAQISRRGSQPAWSPDGKYVAFRSQDTYSLAPKDLLSVGASRIHVVELKTGSERVLNLPQPTERWQTFPTWSIDGSRVLFAAYGLENSELWSAPLDGSAPVRIASSENSVYLWPAYGSSGDRIFFTAFTPAQEFGIWQLKLTRKGLANGEATEVLRTGPLIPRDLSVSRDGRLLAYSLSSTNSTLWSLGLTPGGNPAGEPSLFYSDVVFRASFPSFSPDGRRIAFFARLFGGQGDVWTMNTDGTGGGALTRSPGVDLLASWTPDSSAVVYTRVANNRAELRMKSIADGSEKPLIVEAQPLGLPRLSPNGRELVYHTKRSEVMNIWKMPVGGGTATQLTDDAQGAGYSAWSPDGKRIVYELMRPPDTHLAVMDNDGKNSTMLRAERGHTWSYDWSPDSRKISAAVFENGVWNVWTIDSRTREQKKLTNYRSLASFVRYPAWSPKGDRLVYEYSLTRGNVYIAPIDERATVTSSTPDSSARWIRRSPPGS
jgi:Tol biopolymer transport system component/DNA-binding winged helix-turn-helix (wHTH) protein